MEKIRIDVFDANIWVYFNLEEYLEDFPHRKTKNFSVTKAFATVESVGPCMLYIAEPTPELVTHEAIHTAWDILDHVGVKVYYENPEALAYITEYIVAETLKLWSNRNIGEGI